jgi:flagellar hook-length control protein FliK
MNITSFKDVGNLLSGLSTDLSGARIGQTGGTAASGSQAGSFQTVWNAQAGKSDSGVQQKPEPEKVKAGTQNDPSNETVAADNTGKVSQDNPTKTEDSRQPENKAAETVEAPENPELTPEELEEAVEVLAAAVIPLMTEITEVLEIPQEDLQQILTDLNLTQTDLLEPENLGQVLLKAMGEENHLSLLTNEENFEAYRTINSALEEIRQTEVPEEEISIGDLVKLVSEQQEKVAEVQPDVKAAPEAQIPQNPIGTEIVQPREQRTTPIHSEDIPRQPLPQNEEREIEKSEAGPLMEADDHKAGNERIAEGRQESEIRQVATSEGDTLGAEAMIRRSRSENGHENHPEFAGGHQPGQQTFQNPVEVNTQAPLPTENLSSFSNAQEIANQILDYMKTQVKEDLTSLEMQLHPASLGTLQINVASKGGILTANFVAQTEQVKAAIETQMVQLREQLEEQGIKVEAIEVTVQTHQFEQSLDQRSEQSEQQQNSGRRTRRIQLGPDLEGEPEELEEADRIAKEMMEANGNTVDYTV